MLIKKKILIIGCVILACAAVNQTWAVDLFSDGFESGNFTAGGWTTQNSDAAVTTRSVYTGTYGAEAAKTTWIEKAISTAGCTDIHVKYRRETKRLDSGEYLYVEWYDGSNWHALETTRSADYDDGLQDKLCSTGANENAGFKIRFRTNANKVNEYAFIDDVVVSGTSTVVDTDPPTPNPATFASPPAAISETEITMTATTGSDASPPVEYYFTEISGNPGGSDSGWTTNPVYTDSGLQANTQYTYTVQMRDCVPNTGTASGPASATTIDDTPPTPNPATFASPPAAISDTEITMTATTGSDASAPVEYYFAEISGNPGGSPSGWTTNPVYTDTGLDPNTEYSYTVQMRDSFGNTGTVSAPASTVTPDTTPPSPDPMTWATLPYATGTTSIAMVAATATDTSGVEYYFQCTAGGGHDSNWQGSTFYEDTGLDPNTQYCYAVQARDKSPNQNATGWSTAECATTDAPPPDTTPPSPDPMTWATPPYSTGTSSITMVTTTATDISGVEYYFQCTSGGGNDSGWQDSITYTDTGLSPATQYCYQVQARDKSANQNTTGWSTSQCATTDEEPAPAAIQADVGGCGPLQSGWVSLGACGTHADVGGSGIDVTLETGNPAACECRNPGGTGTLADVEADLLFANDEQSGPNADFILTLSNLTDGANYQLLSYHNRSDEGDTTIPSVTVTGATNVTKPGSILQSHAIMDNPAEITFTAGSGDVAIRYEAPSGGCSGCQTFFNGFELYSLGTTIGFETDASGGLETITPALLSVVVTNADPGETYTVDYEATGGTATGGVDYTLNPDTLTFNPGETQKNISIDIVDDGVGEPDETIIVTLSSPTGLDATLGISEHTYTISDYQPDVAFETASSAGTEDVTPADIAVSLSHATSDTVTVDYAVTGGTATGGGVDYTLLGTGTLTFDPCVVTQYVSLDIVDDGDIESAETVELTLSNPTNATLGSITQHTYTINDNDLTEGIMWDSLTWYYSGAEGDLFINIDGDLEWSPQGGEQYITRIPDQALSQVGHVVERSYYWLTDGDHDCPDCFACPDGCYDDSIECIAGTSDMRVGLFEADGEWVTSDGFSVTGSSIFAGYKGYAWRFGPNMIAGPTRWVDCLDEVHKTGNFQKKPASLDNLMYTNDGLTDYIPGFELTPGEWSVLTVKLERTGSSSVRSSITLNDRTYSWTDSSSSDQPSKVDVLAVHMRNHRPYSHLVLGSTTGPDNNPPDPDPMTWATAPYGSGSTAITMVATTATDVSGVEYYFECTAGGGNDSGWQDNTIYADTGLQPSTSYTYRVMARDKSPNQNPTGWSTEETGTTLASEPSKIAPTAITTTCSSVNYQLEGYYTSNENGLTGDLHTNLIGSDPSVPPPPGDGTMWLSLGISGEWVKYEFDQIYTLTNMWVWNYNQDVTGQGDLRVNRGFNECTIEYSTNGSDWTQLGGTHTFAIADGTPTYAHNTKVNLGNVDAKYVRLTCISNHGGTHAGLSEVRFYHAGP